MRILLFCGSVSPKISISWLISFCYLKREGKIASLSNFPAPLLLSKRRERLSIWVRIEDPDGATFLVGRATACENLTLGNVSFFPWSHPRCGPKLSRALPPGAAQVSCHLCSSPQAFLCLHIFRGECKSLPFGFGLSRWQRLAELDPQPYESIRVHVTFAIALWVLVNLKGMVESRS